MSDEKREFYITVYLRDTALDLMPAIPYKTKAGAEKALQGIYDSMATGDGCTIKSGNVVTYISRSRFIYAILNE